jgi:hypothetical protein
LPDYYLLDRLPTPLKRPLKPCPEGTLSKAPERFGYLSSTTDPVPDYLQSKEIKAPPGSRDLPALSSLFLRTCMLVHVAHLLNTYSEDDNCSMC